MESHMLTSMATCETVRVRFAPAPTGYLHIGGARTALFNWLFARGRGGQMLLRIEDTDAERSRPELVDAILDGLTWLGIDWDGEPIHQSARRDVHLAAAEKLLAEGKAYRCDCDPEQVRARAHQTGRPPGYDGYCRDRDVPPGEGVVVRFRIPEGGPTVVEDVIRGRVTFEHENLEDFVIVRSSGLPTFLLANAVDDAEQGITHVIRGEDLLSSTPKVLLLRDALGLGAPPVFAHLPLIVDEQRRKLSKRRDHVFVGEYRELGYVPEALVNYLALLGWGPPDGVEIRPVEEIVDLFHLEDVNSAPAFFDLAKLDHFNAEWIRRLDVDDFVRRSRPFLEKAGLPADAGDRLGPLARLVQERVKRLDEVPEMVSFLFVEPEMDDESWKKVFGSADPGAAAVLDDAIEEFGSCDWDQETIHEVMRTVAERHGWKLAKATMPVRVAVTGSHIGPPLVRISGTARQGADARTSPPREGAVGAS